MPDPKPRATTEYWIGNPANHKPGDVLFVIGPDSQGNPCRFIPLLVVAVQNGWYQTVPANIDGQTLFRRPSQLTPSAN
jgi:hypothetical protein